MYIAHYGYTQIKGEKKPLEEIRLISFDRSRHQDPRRWLLLLVLHLPNQSPCLERLSLIFVRNHHLHLDHQAYINSSSRQSILHLCIFPALENINFKTKVWGNDWDLDWVI